MCFMGCYIHDNCFLPEGGQMGRGIYFANAIPCVDNLSQLFWNKHHQDSLIMNLPLGEFKINNG